MADTYDSHADLITDQLLDDPGLLTDVDEQFAAKSDEGYGQWISAEEPADEISPPPAGDDPAPNVTLTDEQQHGLETLEQAMSSTSSSPLLAGSGRGLYVHPDDDADSTDVDPHDTNGLAAPPAAAIGLPRDPWWKLTSKRHQRVLAVAAVAVVALVVVALIVGDSDDESASTVATTTPPFTAPTVTETAEAPAAPSGTPEADGPIGIKRADSRCTAGSTDPMQAFDNNLDTAWMCVPAYGVPGTVLRVEFDDWYQVTGMVIVPGWNRVNHDSSDGWLKHMTAAVVEYQFNDPEQTRLVQETLNLRDEVATPVNPPVLASAMTITITSLGRPTGEVADVSTLPGGDATLGSQNPQTGDLKDFAISTIAVIGHRPT